MLLVELGGGVSHFWLNPDTEFHAVLLRIGKESLNAFGQFLGINNPVAKGCVVGDAAVFIAKPTVIHYEELTAH